MWLGSKETSQNRDYDVYRTGVLWSCKLQEGDETGPQQFLFQLVMSVLRHVGALDRHRRLSPSTLLLGPVPLELASRNLFLNCSD